MDQQQWRSPASRDHPRSLEPPGTSGPSMEQWMLAGWLFYLYFSAIPTLAVEMPNYFVSIFLVVMLSFFKPRVLVSRVWFSKSRKSMGREGQASNTT